MKKHLIVAITILVLILAGINTTYVKDKVSEPVEPVERYEEPVEDTKADDGSTKDASVVAVEEETEVKKEEKHEVKEPVTSKPPEPVKEPTHKCWRCGANAEYYYTDLWLCYGCYIEKYADDEFAKTTVVVGTCDYCHGDITNQEDYGCTEGMEILCEDCYAIHLQDPMDPGPMGEMGRE